MAPEQIQGKEVDHRADIFSLGVVFYEMLTRRKPFQGENLTAVTHKIVYEPFTPAEEIVEDLPPGLTAIMSRCLEKDPNRRYPRAAEIAAELRRSGSNPSAGARGRRRRHLGDPGGRRGDRRPDEHRGHRRPRRRYRAGPRRRRRHRAGVAPSPAGRRCADAPIARSPTASRAEVAPAAELARIAALRRPPPRPRLRPGRAAAAPALAPLRRLSDAARRIALPVSSLAGSTKVSAAPQRIRSPAPRCSTAWSGWPALTVVGPARALGDRPDRSAGPRRRPDRPREEQRQLDLQAALVGGPRSASTAATCREPWPRSRRPQQLEPESAAARAMRAEIERVSLDLASAAEREQRVSEGLILAREEYAEAALRSRDRRRATACSRWCRSTPKRSSWPPTPRPRWAAEGARARAEIGPRGGAGRGGERPGPGARPRKPVALARGAGAGRRRRDRRDRLLLRASPRACSRSIPASVRSSASRSSS